MRAGGGGNESHQVAEELRSVVRMDDVGGAAAKIQLVEQSRYEGGGLVVGKWDE